MARPVGSKDTVGAPRAQPNGTRGNGHRGRRSPMPASAQRKPNGRSPPPRATPHARATPASNAARHFDELLPGAHCAHPHTHTPRQSVVIRCAVAFAGISGPHDRDPTAAPRPRGNTQQASERAPRCWPRTSRRAAPRATPRGPTVTPGRPRRPRTRGARPGPSRAPRAARRAAAEPWARPETKWL